MDNEKKVIDELKEYREKLSKLTEEEQKQRDLYLKQLADGTLQGPPTGYPSLDKTWLKNYSSNSLTVDIPELKAFDYVYDKNKNNLDDIAIEYIGQQISYRKFFLEIEKTSKALLQLGVKKGDVVTLAMATTPEMAYLFYAINRIGATVNAVDPRYTLDEFKERITQSNSKYFFGINMSVQQVYKKKEDLGLSEIVEVSPMESVKNILIKSLVGFSDKKNTCRKWKEFIKQGSKYKGEIDSEYDEKIPAAIVYTGGTTGIPKGVMLTNKAFVTMSYNNEISIDYNYKRGETMLNFLPPFSAYSIVNALHDPLSWGFKTIMIPMFKPTDFPKLMLKYKPNHVLSGPILWDYMMKDKKCAKMDLSFLKSPVSGGDAMSEEFEHRLNEYLKSHGCQYKVQQGYGMSEVAAAATYSTEKSYQSGSVGVPYFKNLVSAFDPETNIEKHVEEEGEIRISTPTMMSGYINNEIATNDMIKIDSDGKKWISTGDIGYIDKNGNVYIKGRIKRMIVRSGNKIFPINIENNILSIEEIAGCAVVGMPDINEKNVPIAHIVLKDDSQCDFSEIVKRIKDNIKSSMPEHNIPSKYVFRSELPLTGMAKVDFKSLEEESIQYLNEEEIIDIGHQKVK